MKSTTGDENGLSLDLTKYQKNSPIKRQAAIIENITKTRSGNTSLRLTGDTFKTGLNTAGTINQTAQRGIAVYRANNDINTRYSNRPSQSAEIYRKTGPKTLYESSLFSTRTHQTASLSGIASFITPKNVGNPNTGIITSNSRDDIQRTADIFLRTGSRLINESSLVSGEKNIFTNTGQSTGISSFISDSITQFHADSTETETPPGSGLLTTEINVYSQTGYKRLLETSLLQNLYG